MTVPAASRWRFRCTGCGGGVLVAAGAPACPRFGTTYPCEDGIIAVTTAARDEDYPLPLHELVAEVEERHFWFAARNRVILSALRRVAGPLEGKRLLDVGCGSGFVLAALEQAGVEVAGLDMHREPLVRARTRTSGPLFRVDAVTLPFFDDFDLVGLFDVIEHADDDVAVLGEARAVLRPGGHVAVTVPAGAHLWSRYDEVSGHKRRYDRQGLCTALALGGFRVRHATYFNCLPLLAQRLQRRVATARRDEAASDADIVRRALRVPPEPINSLLALLVRLESPLRALPLVTGGSLVAVGERED